ARQAFPSSLLLSGLGRSHRSAPRAAACVSGASNLLPARSIRNRRTEVLHTPSPHPTSRAPGHLRHPTLSEHSAVEGRLLALHAHVHPVDEAAVVCAP